MTSAFEAIDTFFTDFAVDCIKPDSTTVKVILDLTDREFSTLAVIGTDIKITGKNVDLSDLNEGDALTVDGDAYTVRKQPMKLDDGAMSEVFLSRGP